MTRRRPFALGAAAAIGFGSLFIVQPALALEPQAPNHESAEVEARAERQAAAFTSIAEGERFAIADAPTVFEGTGEPGETLVLGLTNFTTATGPGAVDVTVDDDGTWSAEIAHEAEVGLYEASIGVETDDGSRVYDDTVSFRVYDPEHPDALLPLELSYPGDGEQVYAHDAPGSISGRGEPGATVEGDLVSEQGFEAAIETEIDGGWGDWYFDFEGDEPLPLGDYTLTLAQTLDDRTSEPLVVSFSVVEADFELLSVDGFAEYGIHTGPLGSISGTGEPGATVVVRTEVYDWDTEEYGDIVEYDGVPVADDGTWSLDFDAPIERGGVYVGADQYVGDEWLHSASATIDLYSATQITSIADGAEVPVAESPTGAAGTLETAFLGAPEGEGVVATATLASGTESIEYDVAIADDGSWSADFGQALAAGAYTLSVSTAFEHPDRQEANRLTPATVSFSVVEPSDDAEGGAGAEGETGAEADAGAEGEAGAEADAAADGGAGAEGDAGAAGADSGAEGGSASDAGVEGDREGDLTDTGAESMLPYGVGGAALVLAGAGALLIARRERALGAA